MKVVMKFGGTSLSDGERIRKAAKLVSDCLEKDITPIVVASAVSGITDELIEIAEVAATGRQKPIEEFLTSLSNHHKAMVLPQYTAPIFAPASARIWTGS